MPSNQSSAQIQQNLIPNEPALVDALNFLKKDIGLLYNSHHIGTIQSFDSDKQTAKVSINYTKTYFEVDSTGVLAPVQVNYPTLLDCPVFFAGGGGRALTFPVAQGDECLIAFNDRDIDRWFSGASAGPVATPRLHSIADGLVFVGFRSLPRVLANLDTARAALRGNAAGTTVIAAGADKLLLANAVTTLNTLLQALCTELTGLTSTLAIMTISGVTPGGGVSGAPVNAASITSIGARITATALDIAGLLE